MSFALPTALGVVLAVLLAIGMVVIFGIYFELWLRAYVTRTEIGMASLVLMSLRKIKPRTIVEVKLMAVQAGLTHIATNDLEAHYLAGGDVRRVIRAMIVAHRARIDLDWNTAAVIDLAGRDVLDAVQMSVTPLVIDCPDSHRTGLTMLSAVAKDGIQLKVQVRVTVRANLVQLVGGATEETVIARVGEGIISAIGSCDTYQAALANPMVIARKVIEKGLDSQTAFAIVSIDIADIDVGENIGARLQANQAEADMRVARAKAEERRAKAVAVQQEMQALITENRAEVVLAESEVPKAIAHAFLEGNLQTRTGRILPPRVRMPSFRADKEPRKTETNGKARTKPIGANNGNGDQVLR